MLLVIVIQIPLECYTVDNDLGTKVSINKETKTKLSQTKINSKHKYAPALNFAQILNNTDSFQSTPILN